MSATQPLLQPYRMGQLELANRIVMAPLTRSRATDPDLVPTQLHVDYYSQRASAGLIITEGTWISRQAIGWHDVPGLFTDTQVRGWAEVTDAVHSCGGCDLRPALAHRRTVAPRTARRRSAIGAVGGQPAIAFAHGRRQQADRRAARHVQSRHSGDHQRFRRCSRQRTQSRR
jgi:2,4-dienoyl-CoA reductase-like NADH-dependent reductase (Old Yellow Enzyme family)